MDYSIHAQAPRIAEQKHSQQIDGVRGDDVLVKEHCLYERDRRLRCEDETTSLRLCAMCGLLLFSPKLTKTSSIRDRLLLNSKRSSLALYHLRDVWALAEKQPVSTSLGVFCHEVAWTDLPRKNLYKKTSANIFIRQLHKRGSASEESRVLAYATFFISFVETHLIVTLANLPRNDWHCSPFQVIL